MNKIFATIFVFLVGSIFLVGCQGDDGERGVSGITGPSGMNGKIGKVGLRGTPGNPGGTGPQGGVGQTGPNGCSFDQVRGANGACVHDGAGHATNHPQNGQQGDPGGSPNEIYMLASLMDMQWLEVLRLGDLVGLSRPAGTKPGASQSEIDRYDSDNAAWEAQKVKFRATKKLWEDAGGK